MKLMQYGFHNYHRTIYNQPEIQCAEAHQVSRHLEQVHHNNGEKHGERNDRGHNHPGTEVAQEQHENENNNQRTFCQVFLNCGNSPVDQFTAIIKNLNLNPFRQHFGNLFHFGFQVADHLQAVGSFEHEHHCSAYFTL